MRLTDVDFLRPPGPPRIGIRLLVAGAVALAAAMLFAQREHARMAEAEQLVHAAQAASRTPEKPVTAQSSAQAARERRARNELERPWLAALGAVEAATREPVYLLSLEIDPPTGTIRLEGEAPDFEHALSYVQTLAAQPALESASLVSHAQVDDAGSSSQGGPGARPGAAAIGRSGSAVVRFSATAKGRWR